MNHFWENHRLNLFLDARDAPSYGEKVEPPPPTPEELATRLFSDELVRGVVDRREQIDAVIQKHAENWDIRRMAVVDRNVMRMAIYEMQHRDDIPPVVSINEAVDIAKKFSTEESGRFVNGILDRVKSELLRPARTARDAGVA